ncbi:MAG: Asp23/Gls24 family envelope stress response protein [Nocardioidaceae bacterium]|nr:Asp23/Gls24 family envelope stress response protein [Nocardioidaceae bacterium]
MTAALAPPADGTDSLSDSSAVERTEAGSRGQTYIDPKVVEKVAAEAVREIDNATGSPRRVLGITLGSADEDTGARVSAQVDDDTAIVEVTMTVIYPASVQNVTRQTRSHVRDRVKELTGISVQEVDITVSGMRAERPENPRVR